jgi:hypothetical protein
MRESEARVRHRMQQHRRTGSSDGGARGAPGSGAELGHCKPAILLQRSSWIAA